MGIEESMYPPQLKGKICKNLIEKGLVEEVQIKEGMFSMICHALTQYGHLVFCQNCSDKVEENR